MYLKTHLIVLSHLIPLLQLDRCDGALSSMPGLRGHRAPPLLADGLASGLSVVQTPNLLPLKRLVQDQLVRSPVLGHLGTWISPLSLQLVLFAVSLFLSFPLCFCPSLPSGSFPWIRLCLLWPEATQQVTWTPNEVSGRGRHPPGCVTPPVMTGHLHFLSFPSQALEGKGLIFFSRNSCGRWHQICQFWLRKYTLKL